MVALANFVGPNIYSLNFSRWLSDFRFCISVKKDVLGHLDYAVDEQFLVYRVVDSEILNEVWFRCKTSKCKWIFEFKSLIC